MQDCLVVGGFLLVVDGWDPINTKAPQWRRTWHTFLCRCGDAPEVHITCVCFIVLSIQRKDAWRVLHQDLGAEKATLSEKTAATP